ncbi:MAG: hypothetical protein FJ098_07965, partial [Deltaproteobacteria bacterium]|nr:hypothetical protein [Deltaproteobacteria bacterium]
REDAVPARPAGPGSLELRFPVRNSTGEDVEVRWRVELRDLDGTRRGRRGGTWTAAAGDSVLAVRLGGLPEVLAPGEEARYVACWTLETDRDLHRGRRSLYRLAARPVLAAVWPETFHAGAPALLPLALADASGRPLGGRDLTVRAITGDRSVEIAVRTGPRGEALAALPPLPPGRATVRAKTRGGGWSAVIEEELEVVARTRILLSTDKPLYQPGQPVHLRALLLRRPSLRPAADEDALLEIRDAKGNKVFKEALRTNTFGVLAATFTLAGQVNMGTYTASLTAGDNVAEKAFTVDRYVLPKMKVALELDRAFYLPGQELRGTVSATYLFGKPVARAAVRATFFDYQGQWLPSTVLEGAADPEGIFHLAHRLPETLVGQPVEGGNALVLLQVDVTDAAGQVQTATRTLTVARSPLEAQLIPESGVLVPGVLNRFFVTLTDPGGAPLPGRATVTFASNPAAVRQVEVGPSGLASFTWTPPEGLPGVAATLEAEAAPGRVVASWQLGTETAEARILVRPSATLLQVGDPLTVEVLAAGAVGDAFLDVTRDGQTVAMATVPLRDGAGQHTLDLDPSMAGTLAISAWVLSPRGEYTRDSRVVWVEDPAGLQLDATLDGETYRPGETARLSLAVTDEEGRPVQAALGIQVVDEAVFALQDARPGLLKLFFRLEEELLKPSFQVGRGAGLTLGALLGAAREADAATRQASQAGAEAVVAAQGDVVLARRGASSLGEERARVSAAMADYAAILRTRLSEELGRQDPCGLWSSGDDRVAGVAARVLGRDVWGTRLRYDASGGQLSARSAGPDAAFETWDDALATLGRWDLCPMVVETAALGGWHGRWADDAPIPMAAPVAEEGFGAPMLRGARPGDGGREERRDRKASPEKDEGGAAGDAPRVRQWFPETLFVEDCLITGADGRAAVEVPLADSITTWRVSAVASDTLGRLGGGDQPLRVFQDFFVDVDFPVFLTRGDEITFPVVVYNYLEKEQTVSVDVEPASWFELLGEASHVLVLGPGEVRSVAVPVRVRDAGWHALMVTARGSGGLADAVRRTVEVRPDGREVTGVRGGSFRTDTGQDRVELPLAFPADAVPGSRKALVQILPGLTSHVVQGMESLLRLPGGCFEQTSSSAWPNVLALRYLRDTEQVTPELEMQALQYVNAGYQRILTFECPSGGFN